MRKEIKIIRITFLIIYVVILITWLYIRAETSDIKEDTTTIIKVLDIMKDDQDIIIKDTESLEILYNGCVGNCDEELFDYTINYICSSDDTEQCISIMIEK